MTKKKYNQIAKLMFKNSLKNGGLDTNSVSKILAIVTKQKPQGSLEILKAFKRLVEQKIKAETVLAETGSDIQNQGHLEKELLKKTGAKKVIFKKNPNLVFGVKITHGDWIYEDTLESKLVQLTSERR